MGHNVGTSTSTFLFQIISSKNIRSMSQKAKVQHSKEQKKQFYFTLT